MVFEMIEMTTFGAYDAFHFDKVKGKFNNWNIAVISNISTPINIMNLRDPEVHGQIMNMVYDFRNSKEKLENGLCENLRIAVETPDGLTIEGDIEQVDAFLKKNYHRGIWDEKLLQN